MGLLLPGRTPKEINEAKFALKWSKIGGHPKNAAVGTKTIKGIKSTKGMKNGRKARNGKKSTNGINGINGINP